MKVFNGLNFSHIDSLSSSSDSEAETSETSGLNGQSTSESEEASLLSIERMWTFSGGKLMGFFSLFSLPTRLPATYAPSELFLLLLFVRVLGLALPTSSAVISISLNLKTSWGNGSFSQRSKPPWNKKTPHDSRAAKFWGKNPDGSPFFVEKTPKTSPCNDSYKGIFLTSNFPGFSPQNPSFCEIGFGHYTVHFNAIPSREALRSPNWLHRKRHGRTWRGFWFWMFWACSPSLR